jgi:hypothetical protein
MMPHSLQQFADSLPHDRVAGRDAGAIEPLPPRLQLDGMLDNRLLNFDLSGAHLGDHRSPFLFSKDSESQADCFVEGFRRDFGRVSDALNVFDGYAALAQVRHKSSVTSFAIYSLAKHGEASALFGGELDRPGRQGEMNWTHCHC